MPLVLAPPVPLPVPAAPAAPWGMLKFSTAASAVPEFETVAALPAAPVATVPICTVAAAPPGPVGPALPPCASTDHAPGKRSGWDAELLISARYVVPWKAAPSPTA